MQYHSVIVDYSSHHAATKDTHYENGRYTCTISNPNKITHAVKASPHKAMIPNIFPNFNEYNGKLWVVDDFGSGIGTFDFTGRNLSFSDMQTEISTSPQQPMISDPNQYNDTASFSLSSIDSTGKITLNMQTIANPVTRGSKIYFLASYEFWEKLGYQYIVTKADTLHPANWFSLFTRNINPSPITNFVNKDDLYALEWIYNQPPEAPGTTTSYGPTTHNIAPANFGGQKMVSLMLSEVAPRSMIVANGQEKDTLLTVSLHDVPYGSYAHWSSVDEKTEMNVYSDHRNLHSAEISVVDHKYRPLKVPSNFDVHAFVKVFHDDETPYTRQHF